MNPRTTSGRTLAVALLVAVSFGASACRTTPASGSPAPRSAAGTLIVLNKTDDSASLIDALTGDRLADLPTGAGPHEVAVAPNGAVAVISNYGREEPGHTLTVVDLAHSRVAGTIELGAHGRPHGVQFLPDGRTLVVTTESSGNVLLVDVPGRRVIRAVPTEQANSHMLVLDPDGRRAYVANVGSASVSVLDLESATRVATIAADSGAEGLDLSPDGSQLWVSNRHANTVTVVDTRTLAAVATLPCASGPIRVKFTPDGARVLVSNTGTGDVVVFDVATRQEIGRIDMALSALESTDGRLSGGGHSGPTVPVGLLVSRDGSRAWVANTAADLVTVLDLAHLQIAGRIKAGNEPDGLGWTPVTPPGM